MKINGDLKFRTLGSGELQNAIIERVAGGGSGGSLPIGVAGRLAYNTDTNTYWFHSGTQWNEFGGGGDITNIVNSGGYMNTDGTYNPTVFTGFININPAGSPMANLVDALKQLDSAITVAAGIDTLKELTDVNIDGEGTSPSLSAGQLLYYKDATTKWTQTNVSGLSDGDVLSWSNSTGTWVPTEKSAVNALPDLTDVSDTATSGATDGQVLRFDPTRAAGAKWTSENLEYIRATDGETYISLTGSGSINPRVDGDSIHFYIDTGSAELVARFLSTELEFNAPAGAGAIIDINAGSHAAGVGGSVTIDGGQGTTGGGAVLITGGASTTSGEGGAVTITGGTLSGGNSGDVSLLGGGTTAGRAGVVVQGSGSSSAGGHLQLYAGNDTGTDGDVTIYSGSAGTGTGTIELKTAGVIDLESPYTSVTNTTAANSGVVRFQEGTTNGSNYVGLRAPDTVGTDVVWGLPVGLASPDDAVYVLGVDTLTTGGGTNQTKWVSATSIGGNSFATWSNSGGSGDADIIAESTSDTVTLITGSVAAGGINATFDAVNDSVTFALSNSGLTGTATVTSSDTLWFNDIGTGINFRTFANLLNDLNIVNNITSNGIVVQTAADTYAGKAVAASAVAGDEGISVTNGDGTGTGNIIVGLDITGLTAEGGTPSSTDELAMYDGTNNVKVSIAQLTTGIVNNVGISLDDLNDVRATSPSNGDIIYFDNTGSPNALWKSGPPGVPTGVQPYDAVLESISNLNLTTCGVLHVAEGSPETIDLLPTGATGRDLMADNTVSEAITTLGLNSGGVSDIWVKRAGDTMTGSLTMSSSANILLIDGAVGTPSLTFASDTDSGLYRVSDNTIGLTTGGAERIRASSQGAQVTGTVLASNGTAGAPAFAYTSDTNTGAYLVEADILGLSAGGVERLRVYGKDFDLITGSPNVEAAAGAISVQNTASYENLIGDPSGSGFVAPVDDFLPNAQWVDLYYLRKSGGTMTGDLIFNNANINLGGNSVTNVAAPTNALDAVNKNYVDNLVASGTRWVDPVENPDLVGIADDEPTAPLASGLYIAYGGTYPQIWGTGSPQMVVNEYDLMHWTFGEWQKSGTLENGTRLLVGVFTNAIDNTAGQNLTGTGIVRDDFVQYIGGTGSDPFDPANWEFPHGRAGGVKFDVISVTASTKKFVIAGDVTASFHGGNTLVYSASGSPAGSPSVNDATYTISSVVYVGPNTEVVVEENVVDGVGGTAEPELRDGTTTLTSNELDSHFGQTYLYITDTNEWVQISGPGSVDAGVGLYYAGNTLNVSLGAGIFELPNDAVGVELYNSASGALVLTTDGTTRDNGANSRLHVMLSASGGLDQGTQGLYIKNGGVTNAMLEDGNGINISGDAGTPADVPLGGDITFDGTDGVVVTVTPGGSPLGSATTVTVDLQSVPNSALEYSSIGFADGTTTDEVSLGEDLTVTGGIVGANTLKIRRIEDADGDAYVETSTGVTDDSDTVTIAVPGTTSASFSATEVDLTSDGALDLNADTTVTIDAGSTLDLTGATGATLTATANNATVAATAGSVYLSANTSVDVRSNKPLRLYDADNSNYIGFDTAATVSADVTYTWPVAPAGNDYVLVSQTDGTLSWSTPSEVGRTRIEDLDDVVIGIGSPGESYPAGEILVANGGSPRQYVSQQIQYIYKSTLTTPTGSPETTAKSSHTINHNLGQKYVNVTVYNASDQQILPQSVALNSANQITVTFNKAIDCTVVIMGVPGVTAGDGA